jgi:hypothetical protein
MKITLIAAGLAALALAGCAPAPLTKADVDGRLVCNTPYMDQVERQARTRVRGEVYWVNCPTATLRVAG